VKKSWPCAPLLYGKTLLLLHRHNVLRIDQWTLQKCFMRCLGEVWVSAKEQRNEKASAVKSHQSRSWLRPELRSCCVAGAAQSAAVAYSTEGTGADGSTGFWKRCGESHEI
jgi:hypothetical protein